MSLSYCTTMNFAMQLICNPWRKVCSNSLFRWPTMASTRGARTPRLSSTLSVNKKASTWINFQMARYTLRRSNLVPNKVKMISLGLSLRTINKWSLGDHCSAKFSFCEKRRACWMKWWPAVLKRCLLWKTICNFYASTTFWSKTSLHKTITTIVRPSKSKEWD